VLRKRPTRSCPRAHRRDLPPHDKGELTSAPSAAPLSIGTAYVADITGQAILHVLYEQLMKPPRDGDRYEEWFTTRCCSMTTAAVSAASPATSARARWRRSTQET